MTKGAIFIKDDAFVTREGFKKGAIMIDSAFALLAVIDLLWLIVKELFSCVNQIWAEKYSSPNLSKYTGEELENCAQFTMNVEIGRKKTGKRGFLTEILILD